MKIMIYQISGCCENLKKWLQHFLADNDTEYRLNEMPDGWCFDLDQTKECIARSSFLDELTKSGLSDADKQFTLQVADL